MKTEDMIFRLPNEDSTYSRPQLAEYTGKTVRTTQRALDTLSEDGRIKRIRSGKTGYWEIIEAK